MTDNNFKALQVVEKVLKYLSAFYLKWFCNNPVKSGWPWNQARLNLSRLFKILETVVDDKISSGSQADAIIREFIKDIDVNDITKCIKFIIKHRSRYLDKFDVEVIIRTIDIVDFSQRN